MYFQNYDKSEFEKPSQLLETDQELEKVWNSQYALSEFSDEAQFKTYDELKARLDAVLALAEGYVLSAHGIKIQQIDCGSGTSSAHLQAGG